MALLNMADKLNTANQITKWNEEAVNWIMNVKSNFDKLTTQIEAMKINPEYTTEDILEVEWLKTNILALVNSLVNPVIIENPVITPIV